MDEPLIRHPESKPVLFDKNQSQVVLTDNELSQQLKQPQSFRRHYLISKALGRGVTRQSMPTKWKIPFLRTLTELDLATFANMIGDEYTPKEGSGTFATYLSLVKSMICTAVLFLPRGFALGGWLFSTVCFAVVAVVYTVSIIWLSNIRDRHGGSYADLGRKAMGNVGYHIIEGSIFFIQLGFFVVTCVFINSNLQKVAVYYGLPDSLWLMNLIQLIMLCPLMLVRSVSTLAIPAFLGNAFIVLCLAYLVVGDAVKLSEDGVAQDVTPFEPATFLRLVGMAFYSYEGVSMMLPIKQAMKEPQRFSLVAVLMMVTIAGILISFGMISNLTYGWAAEQIITLNLEMNVGTTIVLVLYVFAALFTLPITLFPPFTTIELFTGDKGILSGSIRIVLTIGLSCVAVLLTSKADKYISLLGSLICGPLAYIFPAILNLRLNPEITLTGKVLSIAFIGIGIASSILCVYLNIRDW